MTANPVACVEGRGKGLDAGRAYSDTTRPSPAQPGTAFGTDLT